MKRIFTSYPSNYVKCSQGSLTSDEMWDIVEQAANEAGLSTSRYTTGNSVSWSFSDWKTQGQEIYIQLSDSSIRNIIAYAKRQAGDDYKKLRTLIGEEILQHA